MKQILIAGVIALSAITSAMAGLTDDLSGSTDEQVIERAQIEAQEYYAHHKSDADLKKTDDQIGLAYAFKHHLLGSKANSYTVAFEDAIDALVAASKEVD